MSQRMRFQCQPGCTECCKQRGYVYLSEEDLVRAADFTGMSAAKFEQAYAIRTPNRLRLRVPREKHCPFLEDGGCSIHPAKPTQCRAFPYWPELLGNAKEWAKTAKYCPGIGKGPLVQIRLARAEAAEMKAALPKLYP